MPWWDGLTPAMIQELRRRNPELELEEIAVRAVRDPRWAEEFARLGAHVASGDVPMFAFVGRDFQSSDVVSRPRGEHEPAEDVRVPAKNATAFRDLVVAATLAGAAARAVDEPAGGNAVDGRFDRWRIPTASFWYILEQRVKLGKLAYVKSMSEYTRRSQQMPFVGRTRVKVLVDWIDAHPEQAEHAWAVHETPASFRAGADGVLVPRS